MSSHPSPTTKRRISNNRYTIIYILKKKPQLEQQDKQPKERLLDHAFQTINLFDQIKVSVPFTATELEKTIKLIEERREYYINPVEEPKQETEGTQEQTEEPK